MENEKDLKYSWNLVFTQQPYFSPVRLPGLKFIYRTEKIQNTTNTKEIFKSSQSFLKETIEKYNSYQIPGEKTIICTYRLTIVWEGEKDEKPKEKDLYETIYKIEEGDLLQVEEKKKISTFPNYPTKFLYSIRSHRLYF